MQCKGIKERKTLYIEGFPVQAPLGMSNDFSGNVKFSIIQRQSQRLISFHRTATSSIRYFDAFLQNCYIASYLKRKITSQSLLFPPDRNFVQNMYMPTPPVVRAGWIEQLNNSHCRSQARIKERDSYASLAPRKQNSLFTERSSQNTEKQNMEK